MEIGGGSDGSSELRILVVEDDRILARLIERAFVRLGYSVRVAMNAADAYDAAESFSCGVFDIELPDGDGAALAEALLERRAVRTAVFYTASLDAEARRRAARIGRVIDKLTSFVELKDHVAGLVRSE